MHRLSTPRSAPPQRHSCEKQLLGSFHLRRLVREVSALGCVAVWLGTTGQPVCALSGSTLFLFLPYVRSCVLTFVGTYVLTRHTQFSTLLKITEFYRKTDLLPKSKNRHYFRGAVRGTAPRPYCKLQTPTPTPSKSVYWEPGTLCTMKSTKQNF